MRADEAVSFVLIQILAIGFHLLRGGGIAEAVTMNVELIALFVFVLWNRGAKATIKARAVGALIAS